MQFKNKRILAFVLALALVLGLFPSGVPKAEASATADTLTKADYVQADLVFDQIEAMESSPAKKNATAQQKAEAAKALVMASSSYVEDSLVSSGNSFTWWTEDGIHCVYSPRMRNIEKKLKPEQGDDCIVNEPKATKGGSPSGKQVYLIGPYYGRDEDFTNQYKNEARRVAQAIGDSDGYTLYSGTAATVDKVAEAISNGAVVFFDSHGTTDYENPDDEYDCITGATNSYLCLTSTTGLTSQDYNDGALYDSQGIWINGATIANHMTKNSPGGILWMAICLGMGTDTICAPLRDKGVEVVYGYSESVTFTGDYLYEETFWDEMIQGKTVAQSIATMKNQWGNWDWSVPMAECYGYDDGYATITEARDEFIAFPVVVSDEDTFPGQRTAGYKEYSGFYGADSLQTVKSTYTLGEVFEVTNPTDPREILTEAYSLAPGEELPYEVTLTGTVKSVTTAYNNYYGNVTVIMEVPGCEDMPIKCYRLSGNGADKIGVGDTITVTGTVINYQHSSGDTEVEFAQGCVLTSWSSGGSDPTTPSTPTTPGDPDTPAANGATLSFNDKANRVEWDTMHQLWQQNGITVLNEKANSDSDVADYANPARFYKNSRLTISAKNMVKIDINCASETYSGYLAVAIPSSGGVKTQVSGSTVTITLPNATNSFVIESLSGGQVRVASIKVYTEDNLEPSEPTEPPVEPTEPTQPSEPADPSVDYVTTPVAGTAYKFRVNQKTAGKVLYLTGEMDGYYFAATENINEAADVYLEEVSGGYRVYLLKGGVKNYLEIVQNGTYTNVVFTTSPTKTLKWNAGIASVTCDVNGTDYYFGSYNNYVTFSASKISYVTGSNANTFDETNFVAHFVEAGGSVTPPGPIDPSEPTEPPVDPTDPSEPTESGYVKITSADQLVSGQYVMIVNSGYAPGAVDGTWITAVQPTVAGNKVTDTKGAVWTLTVTSDGVTLMDANNVYVAPKGGNNNGISTGTPYSWAVSEEDGVFRFAGTGSDTVLLASNADAEYGNKFRGYKTTTVAGNAELYPSYFTLYKLTEGTPIDPTEPSEPTEPSVEPTEPADSDYVTEPEAGKAYKFMLTQKNLGKNLYITGEMDGYYYATTENADQAVDVYFEAVSGGYRVYLLKNGVKYYLEIVLSGTYKNVVFTTTPTKVLKWNTQIASVTCDVDGEDYYFGTYNTYKTFSASQVSRVTGEGAATFDTTNFVAHFYAVDSEAPIGPSEPGTQIPGDLDGNELLTTDDVVALLLHISMPDVFELPEGVNADFTGEGDVTTDDAVKLLLHLSMPDEFPL